MTTKITITQLRSMIKEAITDLPGGEKDDEKVPFPSAADKQTAIDHQRPADAQGAFDQFVKEFQKTAKMQGYSLDEMKNFLQSHIKMIKRDLQSGADPNEYAYYLVNSAMNLNKVSGMNWF